MTIFFVQKYNLFSQGQGQSLEALQNKCLKDLEVVSSPLSEFFVFNSIVLLK